MQAALDQARADAQRRRNIPPGPVNALTPQSGISVEVVESEELSRAEPTAGFEALSKRRWTAEERARMQTALDEVHAGIARRETERRAAGSRPSIPTTSGTPPTPAPTPDLLPPRTTKSTWSAEYRAQMQAALAAAQRRYLKNEASATVPSAAPTARAAESPSMLDRAWTDSDRHLLRRALEALRASKVRALQATTPTADWTTNSAPAARGATEGAVAGAEEVEQVNKGYPPLPSVERARIAKPVESSPADPRPSDGDFAGFRLEPPKEANASSRRIQPKSPMPSDEPVLVVTSADKTKVTEFRLPPPPKPGVRRPAIALDPERVNSILRDDASATQLLAGLFAGDEHELPGSGVTATDAPEVVLEEAEQCIAGLDVAHSKLVVALVQRVDWNRSELAALAMRLDLMLDGALERINEIALDVADGLLVEDDGEIQVDEHVAALLRKQWSV